MLRRRLCAVLAMLLPCASASGAPWELTRDFTYYPDDDAAFQPQAQLGDGAGHAWWYMFAEPGVLAATYPLMGFRHDPDWTSAEDSIWSARQSSIYPYVGPRQTDLGDVLSHPDSIVPVGAPGVRIHPSEMDRQGFRGDVIVTWRAPWNGEFRFLGTFWEENRLNTDGIDVSIRIAAGGAPDGDLVLGPIGLDSYDGVLAGAPFDFTRTLAVEDEVHFRISARGSDFADWSALDVSVVPEPTTLSLLALAGVALVRPWRRLSTQPQSAKPSSASEGLDGKRV